MLKAFRSPSCALLLASLVCCHTSFAVEEDLNRMLGRQAHNSGLPIVPATGKVTIDGDLSEWDLSGRIWSFTDIDVREDYSVQTAAMWDQDALYLALIWRDATPMVSTIDPDINPTWGWKSDALQLRVSSDKTQWLTFWHFTPKAENILHIETWQARDNNRPPRATQLLRGQSGSTDLGHGIEVAYRKAEDGRGFVQEIRLPWTLIYEKPPKIIAGNSFNLGLEFLWGNPSGTRTIHRYSDNLQPGTTSREFFWQNYKGWGSAELLANGKIPLRTYVAKEWRLQGLLPIEVDLPAHARRFTVVIENEKGEPIRSLGGDLSPQDYQVKEKEGVITVAVPWDLRDNLTHIVPSGNYKARGLYHEGLEAMFDTYYHQPGTPPWSTPDSSSAWLADHSSPHRVVALGERTFVAAREAEGGHGLIALDQEGKKIWGEHRGASLLTGDDRYLYAIAYHDKSTGTLWRYDHQGEYQPYHLNGVDAPFNLNLENYLNPALSVSAIAANDQHLLFALRPREEGEPQLVALDKATLGPAGKATLPEQINHLSFDKNGTLYGLSKSKLYQLDLKGGEHRLIPLPSGTLPTALATDPEGHLFIYDNGPDQQIKRFTPQGKLAGTIGKKGGHLRHGRFDPSGVRSVSSLAVDSRGVVWATSNSMDPRRVTAWSKEGKLLHDLIGNAQYAGTGSYLDPKKPDYGYIGSLEFQLDRQNNRYHLERILWSPDPAKNEAFELWSFPHWFSNPVFIESSASGKKHRYIFNNRRIFAAIYMERGDHYQPVAAIFQKRYALQIPGIEWPDHKEMTVFWNDTNRDGAISLDECEIVPEAMSISGYWGSIPGEGLELYTSRRNGSMRHRPVGFDPDGAPRYALSGIENLETPTNGDYYPIPEEKQVLLLGNVGRHAKGIFGIDPDLNRILWHWPSDYNNVHGSHKAPMSRAGLVIGGMKFMGKVDVNAEVGQVTAIRGNLGQDYYFTTDGLLIGAIFRDVRLPLMALPDSLEGIRETPLQTFSMGGEPFSGWLGKMADGRILNTTSLIREAGSTIEIRGLEKVKRFNVPSVITVNDALRVQAEQIPPMRDPAQERQMSYLVRQLDAPLPLEGKEADKAWRTLKRAPIESSTSVFKGTFAIGYDRENLYVQMEVDDASPWKNGGRNMATLFKSGDAFDLQIGPAEPAKRNAPIAGDQRLIIAPYNGEATAVLMRPIDPQAAAEAKYTYRSPVIERPFDRVEIATAVQTHVEVKPTRWLVRAIIPQQLLELNVQPGEKLRADIGFIASNEQGTLNIARTYWSNQQTNLVNDEPSEATLSPSRWGVLEFEPAK